MATIDYHYHEILKRIREEGVNKGDRTGTGTRSIFSYTLEYDMKDGFPLLTTKKMFTKGIITELLWFLSGETNIRPLVLQGNNIWVGDAFKNYFKQSHDFKGDWPDDEDSFKERIKTDDEFAKEWGELGPVYGKQWVRWGGYRITPSTGWLHRRDGVWCIKWSDLHSFSHGTHWSYYDIIDSDQSKYNDEDEGKKVTYKSTTIDYDLKTFIPISVATVIDDTVTYKNSINQIQNAIDTLKTNPDSRRIMVSAWNPAEIKDMVLPPCHWAFELYTEELTDNEFRELYSPELWQDIAAYEKGVGFMEFAKQNGFKTRRLSLKWHQRSVDTPLGLPFNIASYAFLLEMIAQQVNMVPDKLIGDLTNVHIYQNQLDGVKEQLDNRPYKYTAPKLKLNKADDIFSYKFEDFEIEKYESYPTIKYPLSN